MKRRRLIWIYVRPGDEYYDEVYLMPRPPLDSLDESLLTEMTIEPGPVVLGSLDEPIPTPEGEEWLLDEEEILEEPLGDEEPSEIPWAGAEEIQTLGVTGQRHDLAAAALKDEFWLSPVYSEDGTSHYAPTPEDLARIWSHAFPGTMGEEERH